MPEGTFVFAVNTVDDWWASLSREQRFDVWMSEQKKRLDKEDAERSNQ